MTVVRRALGEPARPISVPGRKPGAVQQREDRVVLVVQAGELGGAVEVVGGADLVDAVKEREVAQAVGRRRLVLSRRWPGYRRPTIRRTGLSARLGGSGGAS